MSAIRCQLRPKESTTDAPSHIGTPDSVETSLGTLEFKNGAPSKETVDKVYDYLDLMHAVEAYVNAYQGVSTYAIWKGFNDAGIVERLYDMASRWRRSRGPTRVGSRETSNW